ncbi:unnamed protein product [Blepharisma stoltei]|uniref:PPM-type phosphatase domain-containing protein n=1 Tax=Blepharisma stoltei TaxID=1481888 RepID=A0AAU9JSN9_9CILI|nr:unnamed protein product [Blepharisma stoltei]
MYGNIRIHMNPKIFAQPNEEFRKLPTCFFNEKQDSSHLSVDKNQNLLSKSMSERYEMEKLPSISSRTSRESVNKSNTDLNLLFSHIKRARKREITKISTSYGARIIKAYAASTNSGLVKNCNEDKVTIVRNIVKPNSRALENWPQSAFFGIYDGHGGSLCAEFLRDNLHKFVINNPHFPSNPEEALKSGFLEAEQKFQCFAKMRENDKSGSCAIVVLIVGHTCYIANLGDSRALLSINHGERVEQLSKDHKPTDTIERSRILRAGGNLYNSLKQRNGTSKSGGVVRVIPGRLAVSRSFGDIHAKLPEFGGIPNVLISVPEITKFNISASSDFLILGSDGLFDKLNNREIVESICQSTRRLETHDLHSACGIAIEEVIKAAMDKNSLDNITGVIIAFGGLESI